MDVIVCKTFTHRKPAFLRNALRRFAILIKNAKIYIHDARFLIFRIYGSVNFIAVADTIIVIVRGFCRMEM